MNDNKIKPYEIVLLCVILLFILAYAIHMG